MTTKELTPNELEAVEREARARLAKLREQRQRVAPEALVDAKLGAELADIEGEIAAAERELARAGLAQTELGRRDQAADIEAARERRLEALACARELAVERQTHAKALDAGIRKFALALIAYHQAATAQARALRDAGAGRDLADQAHQTARGLVQQGVAAALHEVGVDSRRTPLPFNIAPRPVTYRGDGSIRTRGGALPAADPGFALVEEAEEREAERAGR